MNLGLLLVLAVSVGILIVPVKLLAVTFRTRNTEMLPCSLAIIVAVAFQAVGKSFFPFEEIHVALEYLAYLIVAAFVYMVVLGTTYLKGLVFGVMQLILMLVVAIVISFFIGFDWVPFSI